MLKVLRLLLSPVIVPAEYIYGYVYIVRRALATIRRPQIAQLLRRAFRAVKFVMVGITVLAIGYVLLYVFISRLHWPQQQSYLLVTVISLQLNFLGSRYITWRDRRINGFWKSYVLFHAYRIISAGLNQGLFYVQTDVLGLPYLLANTADIIVSTA